MDILLYYINSVFLKTKCNLVLYSHFYRLESQISNKNITDYVEQSPLVTIWTQHHSWRHNSTVVNSMAAAVGSTTFTFGYF